MIERQRTVLLVDNDEGFLEAISTRLEYAGFRCLSARSGAQGVSLFHEYDPDAVITDLNMPSGDGVSLAKTIRSQGNTPIIVVTGFEDAYQNELFEILDLEVLNKPFEFEVLMELLETEIGMASTEL